ncbi:MAG: polysaccharide biosynthesis tyrosine autokinase [Clostridia bacterium]|nr:polysaccharide biosynthesis tyrosine autokinase [Clostridia bacterium]
MDKKEKNSLKRLSNVLKKSSLKIVLILFLFILCGYFYSYNMVVPKYKSISTMLLTSDNVNKDNDSLTQNDINLNKNLIGTYGRILKSSSVLNKVIERLHLDMEEDELYQNIEIEEVKDTQIIEIGVIHEDPAEAQKIAGTLNDVFIQEIREFYKIDNISIVDQASYATEPYNIHHMVDIVMFLVAGIVVCTVMVSIVYVLDTTIKIEQDIEEYVGLNVVGVVPFHKSKTNEELIVHHHSKSVVSEAFKTIRTNIAFSKSKEESKTILFTSCNASEGKSWITANMAVAYAWSNKNVIIVDADMRKGRQHNIFEVSNENGLSECLREIKDSEDYKTLKNYIKQTNVPKVHIITIGAVPPNPSELLSSGKLNELIQMLKCVYDVVIIDGTPCNLVADSIPVSRIVDSTVLVTECRRTKIEDLKNVVKLIQNVGGNIEGAILNKKEIKGKEYGKGYYYGKIDDNNTTVELQTYTVKELIANRKQKVEEIQIIEEPTIKEEQITLLAEKIEGLEDKLLKIPDMNLAGYTKAVEDIRAIYENEIDKNKLAENIKENIIKNELVKKLEQNNEETKNVLAQKMEQLNRGNEIGGLIQKIESIENAINQDTTEEKIVSMISEMKEEQNRKMEELNSSKALSDILERMDRLTQNQNENIEKNGLETRYLLENSNQATRDLLENSSEATRNLLASSQEETKNLIERTNQATRSILEENKIETQNLLEEKIATLNYKQEINELMNKINSLENNMNQDTTQETIKMIEANIQDMILDMREEQNEKMQEIDTRNVLTETKNLIQESKLETQNLLEEKIANLNYKQEINELMNKINNLENNMSQDTTEESIKMIEEKIQTMILEMKEEQSEITQKLLEETFKTMISNMIDNQNETRTLLEEKMANLNYKDEISNLMNKITDVEQAVNSKESEEKLSKAVEKIKLDNEKKLEQLDSSAQIKEIMKELKKINNRYDKLALEVNKNLTAMKKASQSTKTTTKQTTKTKVANKNNVIELETAKKKMNQEELVIEYGKEIEYEQLLDLAIGVYEFNTNQNKRRAE